MKSGERVKMTLRATPRINQTSGANLGAIFNARICSFEVAPKSIGSPIAQDFGQIIVNMLHPEGAEKKLDGEALVPPLGLLVGSRETQKIQVRVVILHHYAGAGYLYNY